jgi:gag-polypeptide of LTR copia-type
MGPKSTIMSTSDTFKFIKLEKLKDDGTNWVTYQECVTITMTHKGLRQHFLGTKRKPGTFIELDRKFYKTEDIKKKDRVTLTDKEVEDMEEALDEYEQKEALVREVIYETISQSMFLQIKNEPTASKLWSKLVSIMQEKGDLIQVSILTKLQTMICLADDDVRAHLGKMKELKEQLEGMGAPVSDPSFVAMI